MTCPNCGALVQPGDRFCVSCGHAFHPAEPTRHLGDAVQPTYGAGAAGDAAPDAVPPEPEPYRSPVVESSGAKQTWASGSSFPAPNPYAYAGGRRKTEGGRDALPSSPSRLPPGSGALKGLGAAMILWLILHGLIVGHLGWLVLLVIVVVIAGSMQRSRMI